ncbi:hypothetical protein SmJEL517_g02307 [Synchytrium microbalum]|uniref:DNA-directed RNA polymerase III subunit RPC5 n=1 Tax=Synchytrium microbalum TaxID=1806994 RepID=A0A507C6U8_9FUNG|nr:uncharacterized protein SmJEL517_g02307 [Synchytrium microbalum]TPX35231.1 hypothetical protein SmJEL517_g02307 [Synchytrium microbalum]
MSRSSSDEEEQDENVELTDDDVEMDDVKDGNDNEDDQKPATEDDNDNDQADVASTTDESTTDQTTTDNASTDESSDDEEDEDLVVEEYDIVITDNVFQRLACLQYSTRHKSFTKAPVKAMIRPRADMVSMEVPLETKEAHYEGDMAFTLGEGYAKDELQTVKKKAKKGKADDVHSSKKIRTVKMESVSLPMPQNNYLVSIPYNGKLYLSPLDSVLQMRLNLKYVEYAHEKDLKAADKPKKTGDEDDANTGRIIQQTSGRTEDKETLRRFQQLKLLQEDEDESWLDCHMNNWTDRRVNERLKRIIRENEADVIPQMDYDTYLKNLHGYANEGVTFIQDDKEAVKVSAALSQADMRLMTPEHQLRAFMVNAQIARFKIIASTMKGSEVPEVKLVEMLQKIAYLIRGIWIVKSDLIYRGRMKDGRTYLLGMLIQNEYVKREQFTTRSRLPSEIAVAILSELCVREKGLGWILKEKTDPVFDHKYAEVVERQRTQLRKDAQLAEERLIAEKATRAAAAGSSSKVGPSGSLSKDVLKGIMSESDMTAYVVAIFGQHSIVSLDYLKARVLKYLTEIKNVTNTSPIQAAAFDLLKQVMDTICTPARQNFALKNIGDERIDKFRLPILGMFARSEKLAKRDVVNAMKDMFPNDGLPVNTYNRIMKEIGMTIGTNWSLKPSPSI